MNKDDSWQDIHDQLTKKRDEAKKKLEEAEIELKKAQEQLAARLRELEQYTKKDK